MVTFHFQEKFKHLKFISQFTTGIKRKLQNYHSLWIDIYLVYCWKGQIINVLFNDRLVSTDEGFMQNLENFTVFLEIRLLDAPKLIFLPTWSKTLNCKSLIFLE